jgi:hypothetical protein
MIDQEKSFKAAASQLLERSCAYFGFSFRSYFGDGTECVCSLECSSLNSEVATTLMTRLSGSLVDSEEAVQGPAWCRSPLKPRTLPVLKAFSKLTDPSNNPASVRRHATGRRPPCAGAAAGWHQVCVAIFVCSGVLCVTVCVCVCVADRCHATT